VIVPNREWKKSKWPKNGQGNEAIVLPSLPCFFLRIDLVNSAIFSFCSKADTARDHLEWASRGHLWDTVARYLDADKGREWAGNTDRLSDKVARAIIVMVIVGQNRNDEKIPNTAGFAN
jgi:hypothetical protein